MEENLNEALKYVEELSLKIKEINDALGNGNFERLRKLIEETRVCVSMLEKALEKIEQQPPDML
ncbi:MAG: hypothetical protein ACUVQ0_01955 [Thermoproteota archaeon]